MEVEPVGQPGQDGGPQLDDPDWNGQDPWLTGTDDLAFDPDNFADCDLVAGQNISLSTLAAFGQSDQVKLVGRLPADMDKHLVSGDAGLWSAWEAGCYRVAVLCRRARDAIGFK